MGILIKNNIVNQNGTPAFYESSLATRPIANIAGRMFIDTDVPSTGIYRDNGTSWNQVADPGAGTTGTLQQVTTNGSSTNVGISVSSNGIGIGTTLPGTNRLDIHSASGINATFNGTGTTNAALQLQSAGVGKWTIQNKYNSGSNDFSITDILNSKDRLIINNAGNYGLGVTPSAWGSGYTGFQMGSLSSLTMFAYTGGNEIGQNFYYDNSYKYATTGVASALVQSGGIFYFRNTPSGSANSALSWTNLMILALTGNILIGTSVDSGYRLDVNGGDVRFSNNLYAQGLNAAGGASLTGGTLPTNAGSVLSYAYNSTIHKFAYTDGTGYSVQWGKLLSSTFTPYLTLADNGNVTMSQSLAIGNSIAAGVAVASTHKVSIIIGGVQYYLLASNI